MPIIPILVLVGCVAKFVATLTPAFGPWPERICWGCFSAAAALWCYAGI